MEYSRSTTAVAVRRLDATGVGGVWFVRLVVAVRLVFAVRVFVAGRVVVVAAEDEDDNVA